MSRPIPHPQGAVLRAAVRHLGTDRVPADLRARLVHLRAAVAAEQLGWRLARVRLGLACARFDDVRADLRALAAEVGVARRVLAAGTLGRAARRLTRGRA